MKPAILLLALAVAAFRPVLLFVDFNQHVQASYQAVAHFLVAGLFAAYFVGFPMERDRDGLVAANARFTWMLQAAVGLTIVEVICAGITIAMKLSG